MREIAKRLADFQPNDIQWITSYAYATRRAESIRAAKEILLKAEAKLRQSLNTILLATFVRRETSKAPKII
jgi:hypothetical protein